jgi:hypothetical protein
VFMHVCAHISYPRFKILHQMLERKKVEGSVTDRRLL